MTIIRSSSLSLTLFAHYTLPSRKSTMSLIHALVARGTTVLAEHATGKAELKPGKEWALLPLFRVH